VLRWMFFEQYSHEPYIAVNRHWRLHLPPAEQLRLADRIAQNHARGEHALAVMEQRLGNSSWLAAERYTIADIALYAYTHTAKDGGFELARYSGIRAWLERVRAQPGHIPQCQMARLAPRALVQIAGTSKHSLVRSADFRPEAPRSRRQVQLGLERPEVPVRTAPSECGAAARCR
jgi:hypothetical protein